MIGSLEKEVFPWVGKLPISEIDEPMVLSVLRKIEKRGAIETAHRVRQRMSAVFVHAIAEGAGTRDPAATVTKALKPVPRARKRPAFLSLDDLQDMLRKTEDDPASPLTKLASRFLALTAQRPGMIRALPWDEIENVEWQSDAPCLDALWRVQQFRQMKSLQKFASVHASIHNHFNQERGSIPGRSAPDLQFSSDFFRQMIGKPPFGVAFPRSAALQGFHGKSSSRRERCVSVIRTFGATRSAGFRSVGLVLD